MANEFYSGMKGPLAIAKLNELWALNGGVAGTLVYKGNWDASSTVYPLTPNTGHYYRVSVTGVTNTITYIVNDAIVYNGSTWDKIDNTAGGASTTDLGVGTRTDTTIIITSSTGADVTVPQATTTQAGAMSGTDKTKLNGLTNYTLPTAAAGTLGGVKVGSGLAIDGGGVLSSTGSGTTDLGIGVRTGTTLIVSSSTGVDATIPQATTTEAGLLSGTDKTKLNGLSNYTHPTGDGNLHVPATSTTNSGKVLTAGATAGTFTWEAPGGVTVGYLNVPQNSKSVSYTCIASDAGKHILHPSADITARIFTIPTNANVPYEIGTIITFVNQNTAGVITISIAAADVMRLAGFGTTGSITLAENGIATALKITSTEWIISGTGLT